jgi:DNA polymerase-3 subunit chi
LESALPPILEKVVERGWRAVVRTASAERAASLSSALWAYKDDGFLPHGTARDGNAAQQPIWLTDTDENPNGANTILLTDGIMQTSQPADLICLIFDGGDADIVSASREAWKNYTAVGAQLTYWQQGDKGWEKKG